VTAPSSTTSGSGEGTGPRPVRFGRRSSRGLILGLSGPRVVALACALVVALGALYAAGMRGLALTSSLWGLGLLAATAKVSGRRAAEWVPVYLHWLLRRLRQQTRYLARVLPARPAGTLALPGDAASLRLHHDDVSGAAMIHDPHRQTLTAIARVRHPSFVLLSPADQDRRVAGWGRVYAACCQSGRIARIQVLERTLPDSGQAQRRWWEQAGNPRSGWAAEQYAELIAAAGPAAERHETTISVSLDMAAARRAIRSEGGGTVGAAAVLRRELSGIVAALRAAEVTVDGWVQPDELAVMLRLAYDPAAFPALAGPTNVGRDPATAGPVLVHEHLDHLRTDSAVHAIYWISEWPRSEVFPSFLSSIILSAGVRRALSLVAHPLTPAEAVRAVRKERVEYQTDAAQRQRIGQLTDLAADQEWADVVQRERDLVAGHGDLRYAGFLCVSAADVDALQAARAAIEQAAIQAGCETRLLLGQQAQAFTAAALPLGRGL
jgi:hypothetical protein